MLVCFIFISYSIVYCRQLTYNNVCGRDNICDSYCKNVGKNAYNFNFPSDILLGKIIGVTWKQKGSLIAIEDAIPSARIPENIRISPRNSYYYIIDGSIKGGVGSKGYIFIRQCREIRTVE